MRFSRLFAVVAVLGLVCLAPAANALNITATSPTAPLPYDGEVTINVSVEVPCQDIISENPGNDAAMTRRILASSSVDWIEATPGAIPWTHEQCDFASTQNRATCQPQPDCQANYPVATSAGTITIKPTNIAPALEAADITIEIEDKEGVVNFAVTVSHFAEFSATSDRTNVKAGLGEKQPLNVTLDVNTNAVSTATFTVVEAPKYGMLRGLDNVAITPNIATLFEHHAGFFVWSDGGPNAGQPVSLVVPLQYESAAGVWGPDSATIEVSMFADADPSLVSEPFTLSWTFEPTVTEQPKGESPAPNMIVLVLVVLGALMVRRRRSA